MGNINVKNIKLLNNKYKLSRKLKNGIITASLVVGIPGLMFLHNKDYHDKDSQYQEVTLEEPINVSLSDINDLNIIINDNNCSDTFIDNIYKKLNQDGIKFKKSKNCNNININDSIVITLDQQYMSGPGTLIIAPYNNDRIGNSDALALAASAGFDENGFFVDGIECGIRGFTENENGNVLNRKPTDTENYITSDKNTSFVTIEFGASNINAGLVAASIESTLVRYLSYINSNDYFFNSEDLIYRLEEDDTLEKVAEKYGTKVDHLKVINNISSNNGDVDSTLKNPSVEIIREFDRNIPINLYVERTKWAK